MRIVSLRIIAFSEIFDVRQYTLMDAMDQHVGPERPVELREDLVFVPSATFQTCTSVPEIDQSEFLVCFEDTRRGGEGGRGDRG